MINLIKENDEKFVKDLEINWTDDVQNLAQLNDEQRKDAVQYNGDTLYRFRCDGVLVIQDEVCGSFGSTIDILSDSQDNANQTANDYFLATYSGLINYYQYKSSVMEDTSCSFRMTNLYTKEEAEEQNKFDTELYSFIDEELCSTL